LVNKIKGRVTHLMVCQDCQGKPCSNQSLRTVLHPSAVRNSKATWCLQTCRNVQSRPRI